MKSSLKRKITLMVIFTFAIYFLAGGIPFNAGNEAYAASAYAGKIGVGINLDNRGLTWVDCAKLLRPWESPASGAALTGSQLDAGGWPLCDARTCLFDYRPCAEWSNQIDDPQVYRIDVSGTYKGSFTGKANISVGSAEGEITLQNVVYDSAANKTTFDMVIPAGSKGLCVLDFINTQRTAGSPVNSGITNLRVTIPGYDHNTAQVFSNDFLNCLGSADFKVIRTMDFTITNNQEPVYPAVTEWSGRKLPTDATQDAFGAIGKLQGGAWEYVTELANVTGKDIWINVPVSATADYVTQLATLLKNNLNPSINIYLESSNEVWNGLFNQCAYNQAQAAALFPGLPAAEANAKNHARRTVELVNIFRNVFGQTAINTRIKPVLCWHIGYFLEEYDTMLNYINTTYGPPSSFITAIGGTAYYNDDSAASRATVSQVLAAMSSDSDNSRTNRIALSSKADYWGLQFFAYEGGPDTGGGSTTNVANRILAERDPGMEPIFEKNIGPNFFDIGGDLYMQFVLSSGYSRYGCWGLTDDLKNPDRNYKFKAIRDLLGPDITPTPTPSAPGSFGLLSPANNARNVSRTTGFDWQDAAGAATYTIIADNNSDFSSPEINVSGLAASSYTSTVTLGSMTKYYWKVTAVNSYGSTLCNSTFSFTTKR